MEDVLEVYQSPYDPLHPVVCVDEMNRQLVEETRISCKAGQPEKVDSEYVRKGVMDVFMIAEPLAGKRDKQGRKSCVKEENPTVKRSGQSTEQWMPDMARLNRACPQGVWEWKTVCTRRVNGVFCSRTHYLERRVRRISGPGT